MNNIKFIVPRMDDNKFNNIMVPTLKKINCQCIQVGNKPGITENIFTKYNGAIEILLKHDIEDDDILVFAHEDVGVIDNLFRDKITHLFQEKQDVGLVGIAGAVELTERGGWWMTTPDKMRGHLMQGKNLGNIGDAYHLQKGDVGYYDDLVCIDGCIMITQGRYIKEGIAFDNKTFEGNDFYDIDFCLQFLERGHKIAVADILVFHQSSGMGSLKEPWQNAKTKLFDKWKAKGHELPITRDQFKMKDSKSEIVEIEL